MLRVLYKKKLSEGQKSMVAIEAAMFMRWFEYNMQSMLKPGALENIIRKILDRGNYRYRKDAIAAIGGLVMATNADRIDELRKVTKFDEQVAIFCRSIGIT